MTDAPSICSTATALDSAKGSSSIAEWRRRSRPPRVRHKAAPYYRLAQPSRARATMPPSAAGLAQPALRRLVLVRLEHPVLARGNPAERADCVAHPVLVGDQRYSAPAGKVLQPDRARRLGVLPQRAHVQPAEVRCGREQQ